MFLLRLLSTSTSARQRSLARWSMQWSKKRSFPPLVFLFLEILIVIWKLELMCQVHFRIGFLPNFETGTEEWTDSAELISVDRTNVKVIGSSWSIVVWFGSGFTFIGSNQLIDQMTNLKLWLWLISVMVMFVVLYFWHLYLMIGPPWPLYYKEFKICANNNTFI